MDFLLGRGSVAQIVEGDPPSQTSVPEKLGQLAKPGRR